MKKKILIIAISIAFAFMHSACDDNESNPPTPTDPDLAEKVKVDRFSDAHATIMKRSLHSELPGYNEPVDFDVDPFKTQSYGPDGQIVRYYNFDVQPLAPAPIYVLINEDTDQPFDKQLNIIDVIPGDLTYNDFWQVVFVPVPATYVANTITSYEDIIAMAYKTNKQTKIVNCPVVPYGSVARENVNGMENKLIKGWYKNKVVYYFSFEEKDLEATGLGLVPTSPVYVTFNVNPDDNNPESGPFSGVKKEEDNIQSHNVIETIPTDTYYSPQWAVYVYDNADFDNVSNLTTVKAANILVENAMYVNCPVVYIAP